MPLDMRSYADVFAHELVEQCAPVLGGIKPAGMFSCSHCEYAGSDEHGSRIFQRISREMIDFAVDKARGEVEDSGIKLRILAHRKHTTLIFAYRPSLMSAFINAEPGASLLDVEGYDVSSVEGALDTLYGKMADFDAHPHDERTGIDRFPHEIGIMLGYPVEDVMRFVQQRSRGILLLGYWNVYTDISRAHRIFSLYDSCKSTLLSRFGDGEALSDLAQPDDDLDEGRMRAMYGLAG
jgi:hypothetical protein